MKTAFQVASGRPDLPEYHDRSRSAGQGGPAGQSASALPKLLEEGAEEFHAFHGQDAFFHFDAVIEDV